MVEKSGAWFSYKGERLGQGRDQAKTYLKEHPELTQDLRTQVLNSHGIGLLLMSSPEPDSDGEESEINEESVKTAKSSGRKSVKH